MYSANLRQINSQSIRMRITAGQAAKPPLLGQPSLHFRPTVQIIWHVAFRCSFRSAFQIMQNQYSSKSDCILLSLPLRRSTATFRFKRSLPLSESQTPFCLALINHRTTAQIPKPRNPIKEHLTVDWLTCEFYQSRSSPLVAITFLYQSKDFFLLRFRVPFPSLSRST